MKSLSAIIVFTFSASSAWAGFEGPPNTFYGVGAGSAITTGTNNTFIGIYSGYVNTTGSYNAFVGSYAGQNNTGDQNAFLGNATGFNNSGAGNTFVGHAAGSYNTTGNSNTFLGNYSGYQNTTGPSNTFLGVLAGYNNATGASNIFVGNLAGYNETGSNKLYIANSGTSTPLIYGEFDNKKVILNGNLEVVGPNAGLMRLTDVTSDATTKGARLVLNHYNNAALPVYLFGAAATPGNNFLAFGGGNAIGNAATQLDFFTGATTTTAVGTSRMTINGAGNIGMGVTSPVHPLQMASGAVVTAGGVWTNASSRDYKENIKDLSSKEAALTLASLTPVTYNYKVDKGQAHVGFIAEDVPDLVATKDRKGLSPMDIVAVLTRVTQEQQKTMEAFQKRAEEQERVNQAQQRVNEEQQNTIANLTQELKALKQEVRMGKTTALLID